MARNCEKIVCIFRAFTLVRSQPHLDVLSYVDLYVTIIIAVAILYAIFQLTIPKYSVNNVQITNFSIGLGATTLSSQLLVDLTVQNPNKNIDIYYLDDSYLAVFYSDTEMCRENCRCFIRAKRILLI